MSVSKWAYNPNRCEGELCIGECDRCPKAFEEENPIIYIAGKIDGDTDYVQKFKTAEEKLKARGYIVLNPASLPTGMARFQYLPICFAMIDQAEAVWMLKDWSNSLGADNERRYALYQGKRVFYEEDEETNVDEEGSESE